MKTLRKCANYSILLFISLAFKFPTLADTPNPFDIIREIYSEAEEAQHIPAKIREMYAEIEGRYALVRSYNVFAKHDIQEISKGEAKKLRKLRLALRNQRNNFREVYEDYDAVVEGSSDMPTTPHRSKLKAKTLSTLKKKWRKSTKISQTPRAPLNPLFNIPIRIRGCPPLTISP